MSWSTRRRESCIEDRAEDLRDGLLDQPIQHVGYPQWPFAPAALGEHDPPHRLRTIAAIEQLRADRRPMLARERGEALHRHPITTGRSVVGLHPLPRSTQVVRRYDSLHQMIVQGWLHETTPRRGFPSRVRYRARVTHRSSLCFRVRPFAARATTTASADFCPITLAHCCVARSVRARVRCLVRSFRSTAPETPGPWSASGPLWLLRESLPSLRRTDLPE